MNHWVFIAVNHFDHGLTGGDIYAQRMQDAFWGLGESTPNRRYLEAGDKVVFWIGQPEMAFRGTATLAAPSFKLSQDEQEALSHGLDFYRSDYGVRFENVQIWPSARSVKDLVADLGFIENKQFWYTYFQGGIRQIPEQDYHIVVGDAVVGIIDQLKAAEDIENESEFVLESHLEDFIDKNWAGINFHASLKLYATEEQTGRQFPAGPWSIDFLCLDQTTGDFVVIELKRGKTSDAVVGQTLRYMGWVKENMATNGQQVRGVVIAHEADEALRFAVKAVPNVEVLRTESTSRCSH